MKQHIHFIGIGGTGMGPLAKVFLEMGWSVSGSDLQPSETTEFLTDLGATISYGHKASNVNGATSVAYSSAIPMHNPEIIAAKEGQIDLHHRSELWAQLLNERRGVAVGGAHGKTTITSMIAWIMEESGLDPVVLIGARFAPFGPGAKYGQGEFAVAEADESDRSFLRYHPEIAVITSIEADHLENYHGAFTELVDGYRQFIQNLKPSGTSVLCTDDKELRSIAQQDTDAITYGFSSEAQWKAVNIELKENGSQFDVWHHDQYFHRFTLRVPGRHNISNALAAIAVCHWAGLDSSQIDKPLVSFAGAQRRFQLLGEQGDVLVVDDYAHHPTEIAATLKAAKEGWQRRVIVIFQPHRYSRTKQLFSQFSKAFADADLVILTDIYSPPPEKPINSISAKRLADSIRAEGKEVKLIAKQEDIAAILRSMVKPEDMVITMGAGPIWKVAYQLLDSLKD